MASDHQQRLEAAGIAAGDLPEEIREVFGQLSTEEVDALISAKEKVMAATAEVEGFAVDMFLKLEGIPGESTDVSHKDWSRGSLPEPSFDEFAHKGGFIF